MKALVIDDEELARKRVLHLLRQVPDIVVLGECPNGQTAIEMINQKRPDLIFLDINMPVMDGFQFLEALEKIPYLHKKPMKIVMLTSSNANKDIEKAKKFNIDGYIVKPLSPEKLNLILG